jgi:Tat protein secretion system quality control protein TatD with DNase activity
MRLPALIDIGVNLSHDSYDRDRAEVIARAQAAGVVAMIVTGSTLADSARALELCRQWPGLLRATAGVHPHHATGFQDSDCAALADLYADPMTTTGTIHHRPSNDALSGCNFNSPPRTDSRYSCTSVRLTRISWPCCANIRSC